MRRCIGILRRSRWVGFVLRGEGDGKREGVFAGKGEREGVGKGGKRGGEEGVGDRGCGVRGGRQETGEHGKESEENVEGLGLEGLFGMVRGYLAWREGELGGRRMFLLVKRGSAHTRHMCRRQRRC